MQTLAWTSVFLAATALIACQDPPSLVPDAMASQAKRLAAEQQRRDVSLEQCHARLDQLRGEPSLPGAPDFEAHRAEVLGRARGEPAWFVQEPKATGLEQLPPKAQATRRAVAKLSPKPRIRKTLSRHRRDYPLLRALLLREGYLYAAEPAEALALVRALELIKLFDEPEIWLERGHTVHRLERKAGRYPEYRHADGPLAGRTAKLLFADRVAVKRDELARPLHRDLRTLAHELGFDRATMEQASEKALVVKLRFGPHWVRTVLEADGAELRLGCFDAPQKTRAAVEQWRSAQAARRRALASLRYAVGQQVVEKLPFDRPRGAEDHLTDGQLRPQWWSAYRRGRLGFTHDEDGYLVFDGEGHPHPPQMCMDLVLDSFERAAGTWYQPLGGKRERVVGRLDFNALGITNRAGVLAFGKFAEGKPELFDFVRFDGAERIAFGDRSRFFGFLLKHADRFQPADVVSIQGLKRDGNIHQHGILIEETDPVTGFPYGLVDQMKWPRRRTWEGIMAEAPKRSLLFHVRLKPHLLLAMDPEGGED